MFYSNSNSLFKDHMCLKNVDISDLNASKFTDCSNMFANCYNLEEIKMPKIGFKDIKKLDRMFYENRNLTKIDFSSSDLTNIQNIDECFFRCKKLKTIIAPKNNVFAKLLYATNTFELCQNIINIDLSNYKFPSLFDISGTFCACTNLKSLKLPKLNQKIFALNTFEYCKNLTDLEMPNKINLFSKVDLDSVMSQCPLEKDKEKYVEYTEK